MLNGKIRQNVLYDSDQIAIPVAVIFLKAPEEDSGCFCAVSSAVNGLTVVILCVALGLTKSYVSCLNFDTWF